MDRNQINAALMKAQTEAQANVMRAQYEHEEQQAVAHVRHLSSQIGGRVKALALLADDVDRAVNYAEDGETFRYARGAFGSDTDTIDTLLVALGEAVEHLSTLRARRASVEATAGATAEEMVALFEQVEVQQPEPEQQAAMPMPAGHGQYL